MFSKKVVYVLRLVGVNFVLIGVLSMHAMATLFPIWNVMCVFYDDIILRNPIY